MIAQTMATARKMNSPTGISPTLIRDLYQPPSAVACGQLTDCVFVNTDARPFAMFILAIEVIKDGTDQ